MAVKTIAQTFRDLLEERLSVGREQQPDCVAMAKFLDSARRNWTTKDREHFRSCPDCQRKMAIAWRVQHPTMSEMLMRLVAHATDSSAAYSKAIAFHLENDACETCRAILDGRLFRSLISAYQEGKALLGLADLGSLQARQPKVEYLSKSAKATEDRPHDERTDSVTGATIRWRIDKAKHLLVVAESTDEGLARQPVNLAILGETTSLGPKSTTFGDVVGGVVKARVVDFGSIGDVLKLEGDNLIVVASLDLHRPSNT